MRYEITIANYEEFFLLYVDGELTAAEKQAVELFARDNPHLAKELDMLQQIKLPAEQMDFADKETLYRHAGEEINLTNYEIHFLLDIDNELDKAGKTAVETFVLKHPGLQEPFMLLKKAKLELETIAFPDKKSLYRKEEKERRVFYISWQRIAVAAAFIGVIALVWTLVPSGSDNPGNPTALQNQGTTAPATPKTIGNTETADTVQVGNAVANKKAPTPVVPGLNTIDQKGQNASVSNIVQPQVPVNNNNMVTRPQQKDIAARVESQQTIITPNTIANTGGIFNTPVEKSNVAIELSDNIGKTETIIVKNEGRENNTAPAIQPAVYKELDTETEDNRKSLYVGSIEINKDKFRGFFRKATSLFRGKAKQQEEERTENAPSSSNTRSLR